MRSLPKQNRRSPPPFASGSEQPLSKSKPDSTPLCSVMWCEHSKPYAKQVKHPSVISGLRQHGFAQIHRRTGRSCPEGARAQSILCLLFVFCNRERNKLKILYWEHNGFWLFYRRLERGTFQWPKNHGEPVTVTIRELRWLLDGLVGLFDAYVIPQ
ncbi:IS66 family insertion sequence element accessory protein TnpB [Paenibacillus sp. LMG 31460]|uniref:IS66 family insertion sequence element accessory protein TnpB n=1 Tax=Paenibacillus germinis TaxID=2654979 RepID=A0ABX1YZ19_9BACL|nr:IS66 family insertion sequence element accessory protein TnpB [Paenibacillus germinis]